MRISDWSSDVCSSDLDLQRPGIVSRQRIQIAQRAQRSDGALAVRAARTLVILDRPLRDRNGFAIPLLAAQRIAKARPRQGDAGQADTFPGGWLPRENAASAPHCFLGMTNAQFATQLGRDLCRETVCQYV